jgi:hypothetical protein
MSKSDLMKILESTSLSDLKSMIITKEKIDKLLNQKSTLERDLSKIDNEIESITGSFAKPGSKTPIIKKTPATRKKKSARGKKPIQPSIQSLVVEILKEKKKSLSVNEIADSLLNEKKYKTTSGNFKNQLRVILYRNQKGLFKKLGSGEFALAGEKEEPKTKTSAPKTKAVSRKKASAKKKVVQKNRAVFEKKVIVKSVTKPISAKKELPAKKIVQPSIQSLIVDVLKEKKKPMTVYEIAGSLLNEKKYQTTSKNFDEQIRKLLSKNNKGLFKKLKSGTFGLA